MYNISPSLIPITAHKLLLLLNSHGGEGRIIGGWVRDILLNKPQGDIDLATTLLPKKVMDLLKENEIKFIIPGLKYGTVTALIENNHYDITTLRRDVKCDGRYAQVIFGCDWEEDANRRDFTINALSLDKQGKIYDYYNGLEDIKHKTVRFIGIPEERIKEDYLRILRFFRFYAYLNHQPKIHAIPPAIFYYSACIKKLSNERVGNEIYKILSYTGGSIIIALMLEKKIFALLQPCFNIDVYSKVAQLNFNNDSALNLVALAYILGLDIDALKAFCKKICLNNKNIKRISEVYLTILELQSNKKVNLILYQMGVYSYYEAHIVKKILGIASLLPDINTLLSMYKKLLMPLNAPELIAREVKGQRIGILLKKAETMWINSNFTATKTQLLNDIIKDE